MSEKLKIKKFKLERKKKGELTPSEVQALKEMVDSFPGEVDIDEEDEKLREVISTIESNKQQKKNVESSKDTERFGGYWIKTKEGLKYIKIPGKETYEQWKSRLGVKKKKLKAKSEK